MITQSNASPYSGVINGCVAQHCFRVDNAQPLKVFIRHVYAVRMDVPCRDLKPVARQRGGVRALAARRSARIQQLFAGQRLRRPHCAHRALRLHGDPAVPVYIQIFDILQALYDICVRQAAPHIFQPEFLPLALESGSVRSSAYSAVSTCLLRYGMTAARVRIRNRSPGYTFRKSIPDSSPRRSTRLSFQPSGYSIVSLPDASARSTAFT